MHLISFLPVMQDLTTADFNYDYTQTVPVLSIAAMIIGMLLAVAVPIFLFIYVKHRFRLDAQTALYGLLAYMVGGYLIPNLIAAGFQWINSQTGIFDSIPLLYYLLITLAAVGFAYLSILVCMKLIGRKTPVSTGSGLLFGIMFGIFPLLSETVSYLGQYVSVATTVNGSGLESVIQSMIDSGSAAEDIQDLLDGMTFLFTSNFSYYLLMAADNILVLFFQMGICLTAAGMLRGAVPKKQASQVILCMEVLFGASYFVRYCGLIDILALAELLYLAVAAASVYFSLRLLKSFCPDDYKKLFGKPDPSVNSRNDRHTGGSSNGAHKMPKIVMPKD